MPHADDAPICSAAGTADPPSWARQLAAQAWCTPTTSHIILDPALADAFAAILAEDARCSLECSALRAQLATCRAALEAARPVLKHAAVDGSSDADAALDLLAQALATTPFGVPRTPGPPPI